MREIIFRGKRKDNGEWVEYPECNTYGASKDGRVCSFDYKHTGKTKELVQHTDKDGYKFVFMKIDGKRAKRLVHRVVLSCFIEMPIGKTQVNHKNGIRNDNRLENLEWCSCSENVLHSYRELGRVKTKRQIQIAKANFCNEHNPKAKINIGIANAIRSERDKGVLLKDLSAKYGLSISQISAICRGKFWNSNIHDNELLEVAR